MRQMGTTRYGTMLTSTNRECLIVLGSEICATWHFKQLDIVLNGFSKPIKKDLTVNMQYEFAVPPVPFCQVPIIDFAQDPRN